MLTSSQTTPREWALQVKSEGDRLHCILSDWKYPDPYLPIKSSKGKLSLVSFEVCSERFLRRAIKSGELKSFRNSPRGQILVRLSWFDEWVETQEGDEFRIHRKVQRIVQRILADDTALEARAERCVQRILGRDAAIEAMVDRDFQKIKADDAALDEMVERDFEKIQRATRKR